MEYLLGFTEEVEKCDELAEKYYRLTAQQKNKVQNFIDQLLNEK